MSAISKIKTPWRAAAAMFILNGALFGVWASRIPTVVSRHDLAPGLLGMLLLCLAFGAIVAFPFAGYASDKFGSSIVTTKIAIAYAILLFLIAVSPTIWLLAITLFLFGAAHGGMDVSMNAWAAEVERAGKRPIMSSLHAMFSVGAGVGAASGSAAAAFNLNISTHFAMTAVSLTILTLFFANISWKTDRKSDKQSAPLFAFPTGKLLAVGFIAFCASLGEGGMADWSAIFLVSVTAVSEAKAALGYMVFSFVMVAMRLSGDQIVKRLGPVLTARIAGIVAVTGPLAAVISSSFHMVLFGFGLMGLGYAIIMPLVFTRAANDKNITPGAAIASVSTLGYGGMLLGPPLIGFVAEATSLKMAFLILSLLAFFIVILSGTLAKNR